MYTVYHMLYQQPLLFAGLFETRFVHTFCHLKARIYVTYSYKEERISTVMSSQQLLVYHRVDMTQSRHVVRMQWLLSTISSLGTGRVGNNGFLCLSQIQGCPVFCSCLQICSIPTLLIIIQLMILVVVLLVSFLFYKDIQDARCGLSGSTCILFLLVWIFLMENMCRHSLYNVYF